MRVIIDEDAGKVYVRLHADPIQTQVTHTLEKHGLLLHWNGSGRLMGVEFSSPEPGAEVEVSYAVAGRVNA